MQYSDYYKLLGLSPDATLEEIRESYLKKTKENHPDKFGLDEKSDAWEVTNEYIKALNQAYKTLSDPLKRSTYDSSRDNSKYQNSQSTDTSNYNYSYRRDPYFERLRNNNTISFEFRTVSDNLKQKIIDRQNKRHIYKLKLRSVNYAYVMIVILSMWFLILYSVSDLKNGRKTL